MDYTAPRKEYPSDHPIAVARALASHFRPAFFIAATAAAAVAGFAGALVYPLVPFIGALGSPALLPFAAAFGLLAGGTFVASSKLGRKLLHRDVGKLVETPGERPGREMETSAPDLDMDTPDAGQAVAYKYPKGYRGPTRGARGRPAVRPVRKRIVLREDAPAAVEPVLAQSAPVMDSSTSSTPARPASPASPSDIPGYTDPRDPGEGPLPVYTPTVLPPAPAEEHPSVPTTPPAPAAPARLGPGKRAAAHERFYGEILEFIQVARTTKQAQALARFALERYTRSVSPRSSLYRKSLRAIATTDVNVAVLKTFAKGTLAACPKVAETGIVPGATQLVDSPAADPPGTVRVHGAVVRRPQRAARTL